MSDSPATAERHCPVCGARVAQRAETCMMCGARLNSAPPQVEVLSQRRAVPWLPIVLVAAAVGVLIAAGGLWLMGVLAQAQTLTPTPTVVAQASLTPAPVLTLAPSETPTLGFTPTPSATPQPSPTPVPPIRYTVQPGDTLIDLAQRFGVTVDAIMTLNGLADDTLIAGQELLIPVPMPTATAGPSATSAPGSTAETQVIYVVKAGDTLSGIAQKYGVTVEAIQTANGITDPTSIRPGDRLVIPSGSITATPEPALEVTPSPTVPAVTPTATTRPEHDAPFLLAPPNAALFVLDPQPTEYAADAPLVLQWTSVGLLATDPPDPLTEWYQIEVKDVDLGVTRAYFTRATSYRLPPDLRPPTGAIHAYEWSVLVIRETSRASDGTPRGEPNGRVSRTHTFRWEGPRATPVP